MSGPLQSRPSGLADALALTTASQVAATSSVLALTPIPTLVAASLGVQPHLVGYQVSLIYASGIFFSMLAGGMVKRFGAGRVGQAALVLAALGFMALATGHLAGMAAGSVLIGVGYALNNPSSSHVLSRLAPAAKRNLVFSVKQAGVPLGGVLAALAVPPLAHVFGWQAALLMLAAVPLTLAAVYLRFIPVWDGDRTPDAPVLRGLRGGQGKIWRDPALRCLTILGFVYSAVQLSMSSFLVAMLITDFGWGAGTAATLAAGMQAGGAFGRVFWGLVADRLGSGFLVLGIVGLLTGLSAVGLGLLGSLPALGVAMVMLAGLTGLGWNGVILAETARQSPPGGTLTGEVLTWTFAGVTAGPASFALIYGLIGDFAATFRLFAALAVAGGLLALHQHRSIRRRGQG
ncbi:MFS transporter [Neotabrizicola sp. VNH66]|uniref:MFS transporter n=1 Tax=Neotabrizicola sp. VNH66 TaxID=3400918 RepID=UPI003C082D4D